AAILVPALRPTASSAQPFIVLLLEEFARGLPVALSAAIPLWAATMAGGVVDALRGAQDDILMPTVEGRSGRLGVLFSLLASTLFLGTGGPARIVGALAQPNLAVHAPLVQAASDLTAGISIALAIAAPLVAASVVLEIAVALV